MSATLELLRAAQEGDRDACEQAVIENNGLIWSVVRRYYGRGVDPVDLYQLGCLGFLKAVQSRTGPLPRKRISVSAPPDSSVSAISRRAV